MYMCVYLHFSLVNTQPGRNISMLNFIRKITFHSWLCSRKELLSAASGHGLVSILYFN